MTLQSTREERGNNTLPLNRRQVLLRRHPRQVVAQVEHLHRARAVRREVDHIDARVALRDLGALGAFWYQHFIRKETKNLREGINTLNCPAAKKTLQLAPPS